MRINLTLQQLEAFEKVAASGSFRAAAQALFVSQPALSRTIRVAEAALGTRLFDRDTRHVALTPSGQELLPIARRILQEFDSAFSELSQFVDGRRGHVTVAALPSVGVALLPRAVATLRRRLPDVGFTLEEAPAAPLLQRVEQGLVDFGITVEPPADARLRYTHLLDDPFVLVCRRDDPLAQRKAVPWTALAGRPFIGSSAQGSIGPIVDAALLRQDITVTPTLEYPSVAAGGAMVAEGLGITVLPRLALGLVASRGLAVVPLQRPVVGRRIGIVSRIGRSLSPAAQGMVRYLAEELAVPAPQRRRAASR
ncbi:LysR substrate-binding domain-containing protein [Ramlibacter tataouinensis]|uniref:LysR family transcriptional regulator n=1 Tax=Ramlibacter tataouinensis TaxID=94132 RepID=UPI0022F4077B|nr:LysR family transcriptional regulator [Ramlibacter tataouinensis]WBY00683.1 LysR substrate-binding domain-containing protein [Ramlibacter tataouinensis]